MFNNEKVLRAQHIWSLFKTENFKAIENLLNKRDKWSTQLCQISFWKKEKTPEQNPSSVFYSTTTWLNLW